MSRFGIEKDEEIPVVGGALKSRSRKPRPAVSKKAAQEVGEATGFNRDTGQKKAERKRGRPASPRGGDMGYWRIYIDEDLRDRIQALSQEKGIRVNDIIADAMALYEKQS